MNPSIIAAQIGLRYGAMGQSGEQGHLRGNTYCGRNRYFARKIKRGPAKLGENYGSLTGEEVSSRLLLPVY
jgi:hypothetical protein